MIAFILLQTVEKGMTFEKVWNNLLDKGTDLGLTLIKAAVVFIVGRFVVNLLNKLVRRLMERRNYLAGNKISLADFSAAAHVSVLDYLGEVSWEEYPETKAWYARMKSRPSFQSLLNDRIAGMIPPNTYSDLDF